MFRHPCNGALMMFLVAALLTTSAAMRKIADNRESSRMATKFIGGVPLLNYDKAYKGNTALLQVCQHAQGACTKEGHTGGFAFVAIHGTEDVLSSVVASTAGAAKYAEVDQIVRLIPEVQEIKKPKSEIQEVQDVGTQNQGHWNLERIATEKRPNQGTGVHVYILDTGIHVRHSDFEGRALPFADTASSSGGRLCDVANAECAADVQGHGTHVAGTVVGATYGVAPRANVHAVKVLGDDGSGSMSWIIAGMDFVGESGQRPAVITMSLGGKGQHQGITDAVSALVTDKGVTVVVAAGNEYKDACGFTPAGVELAVTVGATSLGDDRAAYSNFGACVDIYAPGTDIVSADLPGGTGSATLSGTSMACPHVAGAAALLLSANPNELPAEIRNQLHANAGVNYVKRLSPGDTNNKLLYVGNDAPPAAQDAPPQIEWPSNAFFESCGLKGQTGPRGDFPVCMCTNYQGGSRCYNGDQLGCPLPPNLEDIDRQQPQVNYNQMYFWWNCTTCFCSWALPCGPVWWAIPALLLWNLGAAMGI